MLSIAEIRELAKLQREYNRIKVLSMDAFINGFTDGLKQQLGVNDMVDIDITDELKDIHKVYTDGEAHLRQKETEFLSTLAIYMKKYLDVREERIKVSNKLGALNNKFKNPCDECGEDEGEEE